MTIWANPILKRACLLFYANTRVKKRNLLRKV
jgi:hypothetical protein